jgi:sterol desaturase/sphingolipid hydroxylase (fatty acid hydroxylase superfamily)
MKAFILPAIIVLIALFEFFIPQVKPSPLKKRLSHDIKNIIIGLINVGTTYALGLFIASRLLNYGSEISFGLFHLYPLPWWGELAATFLLVDLWMYIWHRVGHVVPFFWRFHRVHHTDLEMNFTTIYRFHMIEILLSFIARTGVLFLLGIDFEFLAIYELFFNGVTLFHHSNIYMPPVLDKVLRFLICSPGVHRIHHSTVDAETNSNYGSVFSFWDRIFFSYRMRPDMENIVFGLNRFREDAWQTFKGLMITPFQDINPRSSGNE